MSRHRTLQTPEGRQALLDARLKVVQAANRWAVTNGPRRTAPYTMRTAHLAASLCRRMGLVPADVLRTAGYNPERQPHGPYPTTRTRLSDRLRRRPR